MAYGGSVTKGASEMAGVSQRLSRTSDSLDATTPALRADGSGLQTARIAHRLADAGYDGLAQQFRTAGKEAAAVKRVAQVDSAVLTRLSDAQRAELIQVVGQYEDGARLVNQLGPEDTQTILRSDANFDRVVRNSDGLPSQQQNRYANLLRDEDVGQSWLRVVSDDSIHAGEVSRAIERTDEVSTFGRVTDFRTGRQVQRAEYPNDWAQVDKADSIVTEYTLTEQTPFYRLYTEGTQQNPWGHFTMRSEIDITRIFHQFIVRTNWYHSAISGRCAAQNSEFDLCAPSHSSFIRQVAVSGHNSVNCDVS